VAGKFEIEGKEYSLHVGKDRGECKKPHFDQMWDEAVIGGAAEGLVK
jgi:hypothetical protein